MIAVDRFGGGGTTAISAGVFYAGGTRFQQEAGFNDTPGEMYKYLRYEGMAVKDETLKRYCDDSADNLGWLSRFGVRFNGNAYLDATSYPPDGYFLYYAGMEKDAPDVAYVAPRGHRVVGKGCQRRSNSGPVGRSKSRPRLAEVATRKGPDRALCLVD